MVSILDTQGRIYSKGYSDLPPALLPSLGGNGIIAQRPCTIMGMHAHLHELCSLCSNIFEGHWVERESVEANVPAVEAGRSSPSANDKLTNRDSVVDDIIDAKGYPRQDEGDGDEDDYEDSENYFYERPDWVQLLPVNESAQPAFASPTHHPLDKLGISAGNGCHLCTLILDRVAYSLDFDIRATEEQIRRAIGIVIVRPVRRGEDEEGIVGHSMQPLALEVSYFVDGESQSQDAYMFTISLDVQCSDCKHCYSHLM